MADTPVASFEFLCPRILDALPEHLALIDSEGRIVAVNAAWRRFSFENGGEGARTGVGVNYLEVYARAAREGIEEVGRLLDDLRAVRIDEARRLALLGEWTAFLAHELKNPITTVLLQAQMLERRARSDGAGGAPVREAARAIREGVGRVVELIDATRGSYAEHRGPVTELSVSDLRDELAAFAAGRPAQLGGVLSFEPAPGDLKLRGRKLPLTLALASAFLALGGGEGGRIDLTFSPDGEWLEARLRSTGALRRDPAKTELRLARKFLEYEGGELL